MNGFSEKIHLLPDAPTEAHPQADRERILHELERKGFQNVSMTLFALRSLYPLCREHGWDITVTLVHKDSQTFVTAIEPGDTTASHYGLAVDLGSTTVVMQIVNMNTGDVLSEARCMNGQICYGDDILTRIIYAKDNPEHQRETAAATHNTFLTLFHDLEADCGIANVTVSGYDRIREYYNDPFSSRSGRMDDLFISLCSSRLRSRLLLGK